MMILNNSLFICFIQYNIIWKEDIFAEFPGFPGVFPKLNASVLWRFSYKLASSFAFFKTASSYFSSNVPF